MARSSEEPEGSNSTRERIEAAHRGSSVALGQLFESCRDYLLLVANQELDPALRAKGGASDLVQETFLKAQRALGRFDGTSEAELLAWLRTILRNNLANFSRDLMRTGKRQVSREVSLEPDESSRGAALQIAAPGETPSAVAIAREQRDALDRALVRLPDDYRHVIELRHREGKSFGEIARQLGRSTEAARKLWSRAIERLTSELDHPR